jgi:hypothetical protein
MLHVWHPPKKYFSRERKMRRKQIRHLGVEKRHAEDAVEAWCHAQRNVLPEDRRPLCVFVNGESFLVYETKHSYVVNKKNE